jgi:hypothetical protein
MHDRDRLRCLLWHFIDQASEIDFIAKRPGQGFIERRLLRVSFIAPRVGFKIGFFIFRKFDATPTQARCR